MPDVITVTSGSAGAAGSTAAELIDQMASRMLEVAEYDLILEQLGDPHKVTDAKTIRFTRMERQSVATTPTQLTEGVPPDAEPMTVNQVTATMEEYGRLVRLSNLAQLTAKHDLVQRAIFILGKSAGQTRDQLIFTTLDGATNTYRVNDRANDNAIKVSDTLSYDDLVELMSTLANQGAHPYSDGNYAIAVPPMVNGALLRDPDYKAANQFNGTDKIYRGEVGKLAGMRVIMTNSPAFTATASTTSGNSSKIYNSFACGRFAFAVSELEAIQVYVTPPGGHSDPLKQSWLIGWRTVFKTARLNENWLRDVRSSGIDATAVA